MEDREYYKSFHLCGFTYYEGALVFKKLKVGKKLRLEAEPSNRYDENAVAVYYKKHKIGFVPKEKNYSISKLLKMGHNPFEAVIQQREKAAHPEQQIRVTVYVKAKNIEKIATDETVIISD